MLNSAVLIFTCSSYHIFFFFAFILYIHLSKRAYTVSSTVLVVEDPSPFIAVVSFSTGALMVPIPPSSFTVGLFGVPYSTVTGTGSSFVALSPPLVMLGGI